MLIIDEPSDLQSSWGFNLWGSSSRDHWKGIERADGAEVFSVEADDIPGFLMVNLSKYTGKGQRTFKPKSPKKLETTKTVVENFKTGKDGAELGEKIVKTTQETIKDIKGKKYQLAFYNNDGGAQGGGYEYTSYADALKGRQEFLDDLKSGKQVCEDCDIIKIEEVKE